MRELVGGKNTKGRTAAVLKSPINRPLPYLLLMRPHFHITLRGQVFLDCNLTRTGLSLCHVLPLGPTRPYFLRRYTKDGVYLTPLLTTLPKLSGKLQSSCGTFYTRPAYK